MVELEQRFLDTPTYSLMFLYTELSRFEDLLEFLLQFIAGIRIERFVLCFTDFVIRLQLMKNLSVLDYMAVRFCNTSTKTHCMEINKSPKLLKCKSEFQIIIFRGRFLVLNSNNLQETSWKFA